MAKPTRSTPRGRRARERAEFARDLEIRAALLDLDRMKRVLEALSEADAHLGLRAASPGGETFVLASTTAALDRVHEDRAAALRTRLTESLTPTLAELDPVPHATIEQAKRRAALRTRLLASGALTLAALAEGRGQSAPAVRQWVHRARQRGALFTVKHDGETLVPAFLLDEDLDPQPQYGGAIEALTTVGSDGWALWAWFTSPSGWLDGGVPAEHALVDAGAVTIAAERRASNAA